MFNVFSLWAGPGAHLSAKVSAGLIDKLGGITTVPGMGSNTWLQGEVWC